MGRHKLLKKWVKVLKLQDWEIDLVLDCPPDKLDQPDTNATVAWNFMHRIATIKIVSEADYEYESKPYNFEALLVHELLHLKFSSYEVDLDPVAYRVHHRNIEDLAMAFVGGINGNNKT